MSKKRDRRPHKSKRVRTFHLNDTGHFLLGGSLFGHHEVGWLKEYRAKRHAWAAEASARHHQQSD